MFVCILGVNIGGAGSYVYDAPVNEAPAAVSMETDAKPEEQKKAPARGPVKGEKREAKIEKLSYVTKRNAVSARRVQSLHGLRR